MKTFQYLLKTAFVFILLLFPLAVLAQKSLNITQGLMAHYQFNGDVEDESPNQNHGKMMGGVSLCDDRFGNPCSAMSFNGEDGFISVKSSQSLNSPSEGLSISAWIKISDNNKHSDLQWVSICCKSNQQKEDDYNPHYRFQSTKVTMSLNTDFTEEFKHEIDFDRWYFYTLNYDGLFVKAYLNARPIWEFNYSKRLYSNDLPLEIGRDVPGVTEYFAGNMDDVRIYNRPLKASEIETLYRDESEKVQEVSYCPEINLPKKEEKTADNGDRLDLQETVNVRSRQITVYLYDHGKEDGDIISVKFDNEWVLEKHTLENKKNRLKRNKSIQLTLKPNKEYYLISKAWNLGKVPPNTLTLEIYDGISPKPQIATINSSIGTNGAIKIMYVPQ